MTVKNGEPSLSKNSHEKVHDHHVKNEVLMAVELLSEFIKSNADPEKLKEKHEEERLNVLEFGSQREILDALVNNLSRDIESSMDWLREKEINRRARDRNRKPGSNKSGIDETTYDDEENESQHFSMEKHSTYETSGRPFPCGNCNMQFVRKGHLDRHRKKHLEHGPVHKCDECSKTFKSGVGLKRHMQLHSEQEYASRQHHCDVCAMRFHSKSKLTRHKKTHLPNDDPTKKTLECDICGMLFSRPYMLSNHKLTHTEGPEMKGQHTCEECGRTFVHYSSLRRHVKSHAVDEPHKCDLCDKRFNLRGQLKSHMNVHLPDDDPCKLKCRICGKTYNSLPGLTYHYQSRHQSLENGNSTQSN